MERSKSTCGNPIDVRWRAVTGPQDCSPAVDIAIGRGSRVAPPSPQRRDLGALAMSGSRCPAAYPYVSRGPRPETCSGPLRQLGFSGPSIFNRRTWPGPIALAILRRMSADINLSCVAQAVLEALT